jgi:hypothetical protein
MIKHFTPYDNVDAGGEFFFASHAWALNPATKP